MTRQQGFTLVELIIVTVVLGILAAIAIPSYTQYLDRAACEDGKALLTGAANALERNRAQNAGSYQANATLPGATSQFRVAASNVTASSYLLTATATGRLSGALTVTEANVRGGTLANTCSW